MKMFAKDGNVLIEVQEKLNREGDNIVMKGKMMGAMTMSVYLKPEEMWNILKLLSFPVFIYLPIMMIRGWWRNLIKRRTGK